MLIPLIGDVINERGFRGSLVTSYLTSILPLLGGRSRCRKLSSLFSSPLFKKKERKESRRLRERRKTCRQSLGENKTIEKVYLALTIQHWHFISWSIESLTKGHFIEKTFFVVHKSKILIFKIWGSLESLTFLI